MMFSPRVIGYLCDRLWSSVERETTRETSTGGERKMRADLCSACNEFGEIKFENCPQKSSKRERWKALRTHSTVLLLSVVCNNVRTSSFHTPRHGNRYPGFPPEVPCIKSVRFLIIPLLLGDLIIRLKHRSWRDDCKRERLRCLEPRKELLYSVSTSYYAVHPRLGSAVPCLEAPPQA